MGLFDEVLFECDSCGGEVAFQSKVGDCRMKVYSKYEVPVDIARDINGSSEACEYCGKRFNAEIVSNKEFLEMEIK